VKCSKSRSKWIPPSHEWAELYICNRENHVETVDITPVQQAPLILEVESALDYLAALTAYFLACQTQGTASASMNGDYAEPASLLGLVGGAFSVDEAIQRVKMSPFGRATSDDPYPNLRDS